jgi:hypothetical protein
LDFRSSQQRLDSFHSRLKFFGIICANHSLARRKSRGLYDTGKLDARQNFFHGFIETEEEESRHGQPCISQDFSLAQFAAAIFD